MEIKVIRFSEYGMNCASCRSRAVRMILVDGARHTATCLRHLEGRLKRLETPA